MLDSITDQKCPIWSELYAHLNEKSPHLTADYLIGLGRSAEGRGVSSAVGEISWEVEGAIWSMLHTPTLKDWADFEHTRPEDILVDRHQKFFRWKANSCAVDTILFAGFYSGAVICQGDVLTLDQFVELPVASKVFRLILCLPWGTLPLSQRSLLRDVFRQVVYDTTPIMHGNSKAEDYQTISDYVPLTFGFIPTFSFTTINGTICQSDKRKASVSPDKLPQRRHYIYFKPDEFKDQKKDLQQLISRCFVRGTSIPKDNNQSCLFEDCNCTPKVSNMMIIDGPPRYLLVKLPQNTLLEEAVQRKAFKGENIEVKWRRAMEVEGLTATDYQLDGVIYFTNSNHFKARWTGRDGNSGKLVQFDGLKGDNVAVVKDWVSDLPSETEVIYLFYRQIG